MLKISPLFLFCLSAPLAAQVPQFDTAATPPAWRTAPDGPAHQASNHGTRSAARITIVESQSANVGHDMDVEWSSVASAEGFSPTIISQAQLDSGSFIANTDVLVVSSGVITLSGAGRSQIEAFLAGGGGVYLQGEYLPTYTSNQAFESIVNSLGGSFAVGGTVSGDLVPMNINGPLSSTPYAVGSLSHHWYGCTGAAGGSVTPFMNYAGDHFGWLYDVPGGGRIVHNTDQDWIRLTTSTALCANILYWLCGEDSFRIEAQNMVAGQVATLLVMSASPSATVLPAYSLTGGGPSATPFGQAALSQPIRQLPSITTNASGNGSYSQMLPASATGLTVWIQAYDLTAGEFSNGLAEVIS